MATWPARRPHKGSPGFLTPVIHRPPPSMIMRKRCARPPALHWQRCCAPVFRLRPDGISRHRDGVGLPLRRSAAAVRLRPDAVRDARTGDGADRGFLDLDPLSDYRCCDLSSTSWGVIEMML